LQEYSQLAADSSELSESSASTAADVTVVGKRSRVSSSQDDADESACSMEDVIQLLQLLSAIASDTQSTGLPRATCYSHTHTGHTSVLVWCGSVVVKALNF